MSFDDALACRRALRDIREIATVAMLDGGQMSEQEALQAIAAIADWAAEDRPSGPGDCGDLIRRLDTMIGTADIDGMGDRAVMRLFRDVSSLLQAKAPARVVAVR